MFALSLSPFGMLQTLVSVVVVLCVLLVLWLNRRDDKEDS